MTMPRRWVFQPDEPPKRRVTTRKNPPEAEGLFTMPAKGPRPTPSKPESVVAAEVIPEPDPKTEVPVPPSSPPPAPVPTWIVQARQVDLLTVASHVGVEVVEGEEPGSQLIQPCPRCGSAEGVAVFVNPRWNVRQWRCPTCKGRGGNLDLAALTL
jgi:hypothetical protein